MKIYSDNLKKVINCREQGILMDPDSEDLFQNGIDVTEEYTILYGTGVFDKNGVEIHEGDIIEVHRGDSLRNHRTCVALENGTFGYYVFAFRDEEHFENFYWLNADNHEVLCHTEEGDVVETRYVGYVVIGTYDEGIEDLNTGYVPRLILNSRPATEEDY